MASSNVGSAQIYEGNEQKAVDEQPERFHEGKPNAHNHLDSKDERSIANKLAREEQRDQEGSEEDIETQRLKKDATLPAKAHGNKPSRGAEIDQELKEEEEAILKKKGAFGPSASN
ncbi:hypothetical protein FKW77_002922 [Venturia effusa]|uniref:Uncharacterized protein n=1 Tax=Venturia effusa TaxID=50376 RepID=A0A517LC23_9PEZI|nr:hypothetical protein FKW77_002922 [Venturia effusa]